MHKNIYESDVDTLEYVEMNNSILIIDGMNTFIRNFIVVPSMDTNGEPNGGVIGFLRSLKFLIREFKPSKVVIVWDGEGGSKKRRNIYIDYKSGRKPRTNRE